MPTPPITRDGTPFDYTPLRPTVDPLLFHPGASTTDLAARSSYRALSDGLSNLSPDVALMEITVGTPPIQGSSASKHALLAAYARLEAGENRTQVREGGGREQAQAQVLVQTQRIAPDPDDTATLGAHGPNNAHDAPITAPAQKMMRLRMGVQDIRAKFSKTGRALSSASAEGSADFCQIKRAESTDAGQEEDRHRARLAASDLNDFYGAEIAETFISELSMPKNVHAIVLAGGREGTDSLTRAGFALTRQPGREGTIVMALDARTRQAAEEERAIHVEQYDKLESNEPGYRAIREVINRPIQLAALYPCRETPNSALIIELAGHGAAGFKGLGEASLTDIVDGLIQAGIRSGDSIFLSSCCGADSKVIRQPHHIQALDQSASRKHSFWGHAVPFARALLMGLYKRGVQVSVYANHYGRDVFSREKGGVLGSVDKAPVATLDGKVLGPILQFTRAFTIDGVSPMGHATLPKRFM